MKRLAFAAALALAGCATQPPVATDFDEDSVTIEHLGMTGAITPEITAEAERLCGINSRKATYLGSHRGRDVSNVTYATGVAVYTTEHEFACVAAG